MQRLHGHYSIRSKSVKQFDHQIEPTQFTQFDGHKLPIRGPFTQAIADRGMAILYVSQPGETPLYYSTTPGWLHWSEQKLALPGTVKRLNQGEALSWTPQSFRVQKVEDFPNPEIVPAVPRELAIREYLDRIIAAVDRRCGNRSTVAVSQSGGIDSLMITWALLTLGKKVKSLTVCTGLDDPDITVASESLPQMGAEMPIPIVIKSDSVTDLVKEALLCFEAPDIGNVKMSIGNILMARKCQELGIDLIFNGHAQDDLHGVGGLPIGAFRKLTEGTVSERWRDARRAETYTASGMTKMFASTFRRYGIEVRTPYYDSEVMTWVFSQPTDILPVHHAKPFARLTACSILPPGPWQLPKYHSTGYITGAGFYEDRLRSQIELEMNNMRDYLKVIKSQGWEAISKQHRWI